MKFCEKEKDCPIYLIHEELNGHYHRLIDELLEKDYYNYGMDAYSCNEESCNDMLHEIRRMKKLISTGRWIVLVSIIYTLWSFVR
jgi:hypothetical protein|nr:MAG TPA: hypothetical protein [Caudoviricetes sp.]